MLFWDQSVSVNPLIKNIIRVRVCVRLLPISIEGDGLLHHHVHVQPVVGPDVVLAVEERERRARAKICYTVTVPSVPVLCTNSVSVSSATTASARVEGVQQERMLTPWLRYTCGRGVVDVLLRGRSHVFSLISADRAPRGMKECLDTERGRCWRIL